MAITRFSYTWTLIFIYWVIGEFKFIVHRVPLFRLFFYFIYHFLISLLGFPDSSAEKKSSCKAGDPGLILGSGSSPGEWVGYTFQSSWASLVAQTVKNPPAMWDTWIRHLSWDDLLVGKIPWRRAWQPTAVFLPREFPWRQEPGGLATVHRITKSWHSISLLCHFFL